jgi:hypothetical protein
MIDDRGKYQRDNQKPSSSFIGWEAPGVIKETADHPKATNNFFQTWSDNVVYTQIIETRELKKSYTNGNLKNDKNWEGKTNYIKIENKKI